MNKLSPCPLRHALTIASSDSGAGAGIQADLKTFAAHRVYGLSAISGITAQNTVEVTDVAFVSASNLRAQLKAIYDDIPVEAIKIGLIGSAANTEAAASFLAEHWAQLPIVLDPVMVSTSGHVFLAPEAVEALKKLIPLALVLTPNLREAEALTGLSINNRDEARRAAEKLLALGAKNVLIKGGHSEGDHCDDLLWGSEGEQWLTGPRLDSPNTHGTGCTLSSALAANLALGFDLPQAARRAKDYVTDALRQGLSLGRGPGPLHHFYAYYRFPSESPAPVASAGWGEALAQLRRLRPLTLVVTNEVTVNDCANALLAAGASPVMSDDPQDAAALAELAAATVLNIGTVNEHRLAVMLAAGRAAGRAGRPLVLDPVGAGASQVRLKAALRLIDELKPTAVKGNLAEIRALAALDGGSQKGVDSTASESLEQIAELALSLAAKWGALVFISGAVDVLASASGERVFIRGGSELLSCLTGTGCLLGALCGGYLGAASATPLQALAAAGAHLALAGERAAAELAGRRRLGEFHIRLLDQLALIEAEDLATFAKERK